MVGVATDLTAPVTITTETAKRLRAIARRIERDLKDRDETILAARAEGGTQREIAREVGLSHVAVGNIITKHGDPLAGGSEGSGSPG